MYVCCLLGYTRPREPTNERRSHKNAGFSILSFQKFSGGDTPDPRSGRGDPLPHSPPARPLAGRGAQAPRCWDPNLGPPQLFSRGCAPEQITVLPKQRIRKCGFKRRLKHRKRDYNLSGKPIENSTCDGRTELPIVSVPRQRVTRD